MVWMKKLYSIYSLSMSSMGLSIAGLIWTAVSWTRFTCEFPISIPVYLIGFFLLMIFTWIGFHQMHHLNYVVFNMMRAIFILIATFWAVLGTLLYTNLMMDDSCTNDNYSKYIILIAFITCYLVSFVLRKLQTGYRPHRTNERLLNTTRSTPVELSRVNEWSTYIEDIEEEVICVICLDNMQIKDEAVKIPRCGHRFHKGCIKKWLAQKQSCPYCNNDLRESL